VFLVLVIACVNVAGLMLVRATSRTQEAGIRRAIGAGRGRLIGQMLAESVVIGALASLIGLTLAAAALELLNKLLPRFVEDMPGWWDFSVDGTVAGFAIVVGLASTMFAGLYPALRVSGLDVNSIIREGTRDTGMSTGRIIRWLVVAEIALSCAILTSAGLVIRTASFGASGDVGTDVRPFMTGRVGLPESVYGKEAQARFVENMLPALERVPGATASTVITSPPGWGAGEYPFALRGYSYNSQSDYPMAHEVGTAPGFFATFHVPLRQGRDFTKLDRMNTQPVAIVSESFVEKFWPDGNVLGKQIRMHATDPDAPWLTVVGVSANVLHDDEPFQLGAAQPTVYVSLLQRPERFFTAVLRTAGEPHALGPAIRNVVAQIDPDMPVYFMRTIPESRAINAGGLRLLGGMFVWFGIVTIVLTAAGIYGVLAHSVAQNAREIAIRRALGAPDRGIIASIARRSGWQLGLGLSIGVVLAPAMGLLFGAATSGTPIHDRTTYIVVFTVLTIAIGLATALPLRRALRLQPIVALRHT
jgi:predicted permease